MKENKESRTRRRKLRRKNQFHRGGEAENRYPGIEEYIHSKRNGKLIRDMEKTLEQLGKVLKRIDKRAQKKEAVMVVGTTTELGRMRERRGEEVDGRKRIRVTRTWVSGMLTNYRNFKNYVRRYKGKKETRRTPAEKRWYESHRKGREGWIGRKGEETKRKGEERILPSLIIFRHPNDHGVGRKEARRCGIPTVGRVDTDCKYRERRTYPIPGNDESRRSQMTRRRRIKKRYS